MDAGAAAPPAEMRTSMTTCKILGHRLVTEVAWYERAYTVYDIEVRLASGEAIASSRRIKELETFHEQWIAPLMSSDRPVVFPPTTSDFFSKNEPEVVDARTKGLVAWIEGAIQLLRRICFAEADRALQDFLSGKHAGTPPWGTSAWLTTQYDVAGQWVYHSNLHFGGVVFKIPQTLLLSADGVNAEFSATGHSHGGSVKGKGVWELTPEGHVQVLLNLTVVEPPTARFAPAEETPAAPDAAAAKPGGAGTGQPREVKIKMVLKRIYFDPSLGVYDDIENALGMGLTTRERRLERVSCSMDDAEAVDKKSIVKLTQHGYCMPCFFSKPTVGLL